MLRPTKKWRFYDRCKTEKFDFLKTFYYYEKHEIYTDYNLLTHTKHTFDKIYDLKNYKHYLKSKHCFFLK